MQDKEFIRYGITPTDGALPDRVKYFKQQEAHDAAVRFSEKEGKPYYVVEIVCVCNTLEKVGC